MAGSMYGADADQLEVLAGELAETSRTLNRMKGQLGSEIHSSPWQGRNAERFRHTWDAQHRRTIASAASFLDAAEATLRANAREQREASSAGGVAAAPPPVTVKPPATGAPDGMADDVVDLWKDIFKLLGLSEDAWDVLKTVLRKYDPEALKDLGNFLAKNPAILEGLKMFGKVVDVGTVLADFAGDWLDHADLPLDERLLHAGLVAGSGFIIDQGIDKFAQWAGGAIGTAVGPGGTIIGAGAGFLIGQGLSFAFEKADEAWDLRENGADLVLDAYREAKDIGGKVVDTIGDGVDAVKDGAENLWDKGGDAVDALGGWLS